MFDIAPKRQIKPYIIIITNFIKKSLLLLIILFLMIITTMIGINKNEWIPVFIVGIAFVVFYNQKSVLEVLPKLEKIKFFNILELSLINTENDLNSLIKKSYDISNDNNLTSTEKTKIIIEELEKVKGGLRKQNKTNILDRDILEEGVNANGTYIKYKDGTMTLKLWHQSIHFDKQISKTVINIIFPASFYNDVISVQFIGITPPKITRINTSGMTLESTEENFDQMRINVIGRWK